MPPRAIVEAKVGIRWSLIPSLVRPCIINTATRACGPPAAVYTSVGPNPSTSGPCEAHFTAADSCVLPFPPCKSAPTREKAAYRVASRDLGLLTSLRFGQRSFLEYPTGRPRRVFPRSVRVVVPGPLLDRHRGPLEQENLETISQSLRPKPSPCSQASQKENRDSILRAEIGSTRRLLLQWFVPLRLCHRRYPLGYRPQ